MHVAAVQKESAHGHWFMKVSTGNAVLNPTLTLLQLARNALTNQYDYGIVKPLLIGHKN